MENKLKILIVDDDEKLLEILSHLLKKDGHTISTATNYHSALEMIEKDGYDILLTDWKMPWMDGMNLIDMAKYTTNSKIKTIFMTGYATPETIIKANRKGADEYLLKPFTLLDLRQAIKRVIAVK